MLTLTKPIDLRYGPPNGLSAAACTLALPYYTTAAAGYAIRDTSSHNPSNDATNILFADCRMWAGAKLIYLNNTTDQTLTYTLFVSIDGVTWQGVGTAKTLNTASINWTDQSSYSQLQYPYPYMSVQLQFTVTPTSGNVICALILRSQ